MKTVTLDAFLPVDLGQGEQARHFRLAHVKSGIEAPDLRQFRALMAMRQPDHPWNYLPDPQFLPAAGILGRGQDGGDHPTLAGLLLLGKRKPLREVFCTRRNYLPTVLRLVVCPLVVLVLLWVCHASSWVADGKNILMTVYLAAITPACATVTSMAQLYDRDAAHSSALYVLTTLLSIVSMPVMIGLFDLLL